MSWNFSGKLESRSLKAGEMSWMSSLSNLTHEQARALLPLLQSIAYDSPPESSLNSPFLHCDSSPEEQFQMDEEVYSLKELLAKKKNNSMSTEL